jgi:microcystin-dependent protein
MLVSTGTIIVFAGSTIPPGFLVCDGSAVSRTTYAALFAVIGTRYGGGDGSTTFNVPDLSGHISAELNFVMDYIIATESQTTGSGAVVLTDSPVLVRPNLGAASAASLVFTTTAGIIGSKGNSDADPGSVGEYLFARAPTPSSFSTVTITTATPGVVNWTAHPLKSGAPVCFTTTGALPAGIAAGAGYYVSSAGLAANSFRVSASIEDALAGISISTSGTQSGTHTASSGMPLKSGTVANVQALSLTPGDWDVRGTVGFRTGTSTSITFLAGGISLISGVINSGISDVEPAFFLRLAAEVPASNSNEHYPIATGRIRVGTPTTVYLVGRGDFTASTLHAYGWIAARRMR